MDFLKFLKFRIVFKKFNKIENLLQLLIPFSGLWGKVGKDDSWISKVRPRIKGCERQRAWGWKEGRVEEKGVLRKRMGWEEKLAEEKDEEKNGLRRRWVVKKDDWEEGWIEEKDGLKRRMVWREGWVVEKDGLRRRMSWEEGWFEEKDGLRKRMGWGEKLFEEKDEDKNGLRKRMGWGKN